MSRRPANPPVELLRDRAGRLIETGAPVDVFYRGAWHRGHVVRILRKRIEVDVQLFLGHRTVTTLMQPDQLTVLGPTAEDVLKSLPLRS